MLNDRCCESHDGFIHLKQSEKLNLLSSTGSHLVDIWADLVNLHDFQKALFKLNTERFLKRWGSNWTLQFGARIWNCFGVKGLKTPGLSFWSSSSKQKNRCVHILLAVCCMCCRLFFRRLFPEETILQLYLRHMREKPAALFCVSVWVESFLSFSSPGRHPAHLLHSSE